MNISMKVLWLVTAFLLSSMNAFAAQGDLSLGLYGNVVVADGEPSNDVLGLGLIGSYQLKDSWFVDLELIQSDADFERPWKVLGLQQSVSVKTIDTTYTSSLVMVHLGRTYKSEHSNIDWYWSAGLGINSIDVKDVSGPLEGGGTFNILTDADSETVIGLKAGIKQQLSDHWSMNYALRVNQHLADWKVTDTNSNTTGKVSDYTLMGVLIGIERRF